MERFKFIFCGRHIPPTMMSKIIQDTDGTIAFANHNFEMSIINGLAKQKNIDLSILSFPVSNPYPTNNRRLFYKSEKYTINNVKAYSSAVFNLIGINRLVNSLFALFKLLKIIKTVNDEKVFILLNTLSWEVISPILWARKFSKKNIVFSIIVPDVPIMLDSMSARSSFSAKIHNKLSRIALDKAQSVDKYVFLTDAMKIFFDKCVNPNKYIVVEGMIDVEGHTGAISPLTTKPEKEIIVYAGSVQKIYGIELLVKAFELVNNDNVELWICGSGDYSSELKRISKENERIKYFGMVSSEEARDLQNRATILINPRTNAGLYTKYSFPSKTIEYLLSGKSIIMNRLDGIPEEYYEYVYVPYEQSPEGIAKMIDQVINEPFEQRVALCELGRKFIVEKKNSSYQAKRIIDFITSEQ